MSLKNIFNESNGISYRTIGSIPWNSLVKIANDVVYNSKSITFTMDAIQGNTIVPNVGSVNAYLTDGINYTISLTPLFQSNNPAIFTAGFDGGFEMTANVDYFRLRSTDLPLSYITGRYQLLTNVGIIEYDNTNTFINSYIGALVLTPDDSGQQYIYLGGGLLQNNLFDNGNRYYFGFSTHPAGAIESDNSIMVNGGTYSSVINFSYI